jgi:hypothetical protein
MKKSLCQFDCTSTVAVDQDAPVYPNQDRVLARFAVLIETVQSATARNAMVQTVKVQTDSVLNATALIDLVLNEGIRSAGSPNVTDVLKILGAKVLQVARSVVVAVRSFGVAVRSVAAAANSEVPQHAAEVHFAAEPKHVATRFVVVALHTTETVSQRVVQALQVRRVHDYVSVSRPSPV